MAVNDQSMGRDSMGRNDGKRWARVGGVPTTRRLRRKLEKLEKALKGVGSISHNVSTGGLENMVRLTFNLESSRGGQFQVKVDVVSMYGDDGAVLDLPRD